MGNGRRTHYRWVMSDELQSRLRAIIQERGLDMKTLSKMAGLGETAVRDILERRPDPKISTVAAIAKALGVSLDELAGDNLSEGVSVTLAKPSGEVAAGLWLAQDNNIDEGSFEDIPAMPGRYPELEQRAYRVRGSSMDLADIPSGSYVVAVEYWKVRPSPMSGDIVVVERRRAGEVERTCKEVVVKRGAYELWPRSSDPQFQEPFIIPRNANPPTDIEIEIVGLVIGVFKPLRF